MKTFQLLERAGALGQVDPGMVRALMQKLGSGQRTKVRCSLCGKRVRKWRLGEHMRVRGYERAIFSCHCALSLLDAGVEIDAPLWKAVSTLADKYGFIDALIPAPGFDPVAGQPFSMS